MNRPLRLTVLGTGYLGITHATCMASLGFEVLGVDTDPRKVDRLNAGDLPIFEPGLEELIHQSEGRLHASQNIGEAVFDSEATFVVVGTPSEESGGFSLLPGVSCRWDREDLADGARCG